MSQQVITVTVSWPGKLDSIGRLHLYTDEVETDEGRALKQRMTKPQIIGSEEAVTWALDMIKLLHGREP